MITALSNFARMPVPNLSPFSIETCIREALDTNVLPANIEVSIAAAPSLPPALADVDQVRIVFANLIRNARDAMAHGGKLSIRIRQAEEGLEVEVTDTGVGISPDNLARITEPLYSTKARGLGLGLAIARAILDKNKGNLQVASELGKGTTFTVRLGAASPVA